MTHLGKKVEAIRDTWYFKAWRYVDGTIRTQRKRLAANVLEPLVNHPDHKLISKVMKIQPKEPIAAVKLVRDTKRIGLSETRDWMRQFNLWSPDFPNWQSTYTGRKLHW